MQEQAASRKAPQTAYPTVADLDRTAEGCGISLSDLSQHLGAGAVYLRRADGSLCVLRTVGVASRSLLCESVRNGTRIIEGYEEGCAVYLDNGTSFSGFVPVTPAGVCTFGDF